jgi:hypothetical protein
MLKILSLNLGIWRFNSRNVLDVFTGWELLGSRLLLLDSGAAVDSTILSFHFICCFGDNVGPNSSNHIFSNMRVAV